MDDISKLVNEIKSCLGTDYEAVKEFFYYVCVSNYEYKILVDGRSYILYKLFLRVFENCPEERLDIHKDFKVIGNIYNSNFLSPLLYGGLTNESHILVIDDIIVNGRTMTNIVKQIENVLKCEGNNLDIWCINCNSNAKCIQDIKKYFKHCRYVNLEGWKKLSDSLTRAIVCTNMGYVSFVDSYMLKMKEIIMDDFIINCEIMCMNNIIILYFMKIYIILNLM